MASGQLRRVVDIVIPRRRWDGEAGQWEDLAPTRARVQLDVDLDGLVLELGGRAVRSKGGQAGMGGKLIRVKRLEVYS